MSYIVSYVERAYSGVIRYLNENHFVAILIAVLLFIWIGNQKAIDKKQNRLLVYTLVVTVVLLCPITAIPVMIYQTPFYDYEWAWSMVPVTAVIAYGIVLLWCQGKSKAGKYILLTILLIGCFLCGNLGQIQRLTIEEKEDRYNSREVVQALTEMKLTEDFVVWAPKEVMQEIRRLDGTISLVYGRDMWEEKAGAFDYEAYSPELTEAYIWLEKGMEHYELSHKYEKPKDALDYLVEQDEWKQDIVKSVNVVLQEGVNAIVLPEMLGDYIEEPFRKSVEERGKKMYKAYTEKYAIYVMY